jgi:hypothetical protein
MTALKKNLPVKALVIVMLVALIAVGVSYGLWYKVLTIEGTVETGRVHARWVGLPDTFCNEFWGWPDFGGWGEFEGKDVGETSIVVDPNDPNLLHFDITSGYPSYAVECKLTYFIDGTIPVYVRGFRILPGAGLTNCTITGTPNNKTLACDQLTVRFVDGVGSQLHPGDFASSNMQVHVEQPAAMNADYAFGLQICLAQWNESVTGDECFAWADGALP